MKKLILSLVAIATIALTSFGQAPEGFKYQAVVRDASSNILTNQAVGMRLTIQQGSVGGTTVYTETFAPTTNGYGLVNLEIGTGTTSDDFSTIDWANGPFYIETAADITGGTAYSVMGTSQLMSVPYALYAKTSGSSTPGPQGPAGADGVDGVDGSAGPQGIQGATGPQGNQGLQGVTGPQGVAGPTGADGIDGAVGSTGPAGPAGADGIDGVVGATGPAGADGIDGAVGATGPAGADGIDGAVGATGPAGADGIDGAVGTTGPAGPAGNDGIGIAQTISISGSDLTISGGNTIALPADADWTLNGSDIHNANSGNVGIGTATPQGDLEVYSQPANGAAALDQSQTVGGWGAGSTTQWQSFTAGASGALTQVDLDVNSGLSGVGQNGVIKIYEGNGIGGTLLSTENVFFAYVFTFQQFPLTVQPSLTAGLQYTIEFSVPTINVGWVDLNINDPYAGGETNVAGWDYLFKTYVAPESPSASSLVVVGGNVGVGTSTPATKLDVAGAVKITDGTEGAGKVLTSDATGNASWETLAAGPAGPAGADGSDGAVGATGPAGPTGPAGADGSDGAVGAIGPAGPTGPQGPAGTPAFVYDEAYDIGPLPAYDGFTYAGILSMTVPSSGLYWLSMHTETYNAVNMTSPVPSLTAIFKNGVLIDQFSQNVHQHEIGKSLTLVAGDIIELKCASNIGGGRAVKSFGYLQKIQ